MVVRIIKKDTLPNRNESMATLILETKTPSNGINTSGFAAVLTT